MEAALVQRLADLRGTLNYLAAGNLLLPKAPLSHCIGLLLQLLRERTMRSEDANTRGEGKGFCFVRRCKMQDSGLLPHQ